MKEMSFPVVAARDYDSSFFTKFLFKGNVNAPIIFFLTHFF